MLVGRVIRVALVVASVVLVGCTPPWGGGGSAPVVTTTSLPYGIVGSAYSQTLTATGTAPITWSLDSGSLPAGLSLSPSGVISGTPTAAALSQNFTPFVVKASNSAGSDVESLTIDVFIEAPPGFSPPDPTGNPLPEGAAILFGHTPPTMSLPPPPPGPLPMFQYLADGTVRQAAVLTDTFSGRGPTKPNFSLEEYSFTGGGSYSRDARRSARFNAGSLELWEGAPQAPTLVHTYSVPSSMDRVLMSPNGDYIAVTGEAGLTTEVRIYSATAPYSLVRSVTYDMIQPTGPYTLVWSPDSTRLVVNLHPVSGLMFVRIIGVTSPALDLSPSAYNGCTATAFLAGGRLALFCVTPLDLSISIVTGSLDGSTTQVVYKYPLDPFGSYFAFVTAGSPSGAYLALYEENRISYLADVPWNPSAPVTPVPLTDRVFGPPIGFPPTPSGSSDVALVWSDTPWPSAP
jgi:hypothetical protein